MTIFSRKLLLPALIVCTLLTTSCDEEAGHPEVISINEGTLELTHGYYTTLSYEWNEQVWYRHHFMLMSEGLSYDVVKLDFSGRGDYSGFTIITSTPELPDGTYSLGGSLAEDDSALEQTQFMQDFYRVPNPDPEAIENLWTDYFDKHIAGVEGDMVVTKSGETYTFNFNFSKYKLREDSEPGTGNEVTGKIEGTYTGTVQVWEFPFPWK